MEATGKRKSLWRTCFLLLLLRLLWNIHTSNASLTEDGQEQLPLPGNYVNLAMAVGMDNELMTLVVYNAEKWACLSW